MGRAKNQKENTNRETEASFPRRAHETADQLEQAALRWDFFAHELLSGRLMTATT